MPSWTRTSVIGFAIRHLTTRTLAYLAETGGLEPTSRYERHGSFQDCCLKPVRLRFQIIDRVSEHFPINLAENKRLELLPPFQAALFSKQVRQTNIRLFSNCAR